jgi:hypothetical protein
MIATLVTNKNSYFCRAISLYDLWNVYVPTPLSCVVFTQSLFLILFLMSHVSKAKMTHEKMKRVSKLIA